MRILCCLNRDLPSNLALNLLLPVLEKHDVRVVLTEQVGKLSANEPWQRRELRVAEQTLLNRVVFPLRDALPAHAPAGRYLTFVQMERLSRIPTQTIQDPNSDPGISFIRAFAPDLIVSIRYGAIFKEAALKIPRFGVLNLHSGILPAYRGVLATFRALMNGDAEIAATTLTPQPRNGTSLFRRDGVSQTHQILSAPCAPMFPSTRSWELQQSPRSALSGDLVSCLS